MPRTTTLGSRLRHGLHVVTRAGRPIPYVLTAAVLLGAPGTAHGESLPVDPSDWYGPHHTWHRHGPIHPDSIVVDCTPGHHGDRGRGPLQAAIDQVRANGTIMIKPPGEGMTCMESLSITRPVTISTFGSGRDAVIEAPGMAPCVEANVPLGDSVVFEGVKFIARGRSEPCIRVRAGRVVVRDSTIDSRNTDWAFDVLDSGELTVEDTKVGTDGSGIHALRADVHLKNFEIEMSPARNRPAVVLDRTDGEVEGGEIIGGRWGVVASSGPHGLSLADLRVRNANTAVELIPGSQGTVRASKVSLENNRTGFVIAPYVDAEVSDNTIVGSQDDGVVVYESNARIRNNKIGGGRIGIRIARTSDEIGSDFWGGLDPKTYRPQDDPPREGAPDISNNYIADVGQADIAADGGVHAHVADNELISRPGCVCISHPEGLVLDENECHEGRH